MQKKLWASNKKPNSLKTKYDRQNCHLLKVTYICPKQVNKLIFGISFK